MMRNCLLLLLLPLTLHSTPIQTNSEPKPAFTFAKTEYFHRFSKGTLHEFTPKGQTDLQKWTDMFTVNDYPTVKTGEGLAEIANKVLTTYKANEGIILQTRSVPKTTTKPAEHLIVVLFHQATFAEVAFTRFVLMKGTGLSMVYSHRIYNKKASTEMDFWITKNGGRIATALMAVPSAPKH